MSQIHMSRNPSKTLTMKQKNKTKRKMEKRTKLVMKMSMAKNMVSPTVSQHSPQ